MKKNALLCFMLSCFLLISLLTACGKPSESVPEVSSVAESQTESKNVSSENASKTPSEASSQTESAAEAEKSPYPFTDDAGRVRYQLVINGELIETENLPFKKAATDKGAFYPEEDVLNRLGVSVVKAPDGSAVGSSINGNIFKVFAGNAQMIYGKTKIKAANPDTVPMLVEGVLYAPSFFFMQLSDQSVVDYSSDGTACTLTTDVVIDPANSGPIGITEADLTPSSAKVTTAHGSGRCAKCGGAGGYNESYLEAAPSWGSPYAVGGYVTKSRWVTCPQCLGHGEVQ